MKTLLLAVLTAFTLWAQPLVAQSLTPTERKALLGYLDASEEALERAIKGLTPEQLTYKPAPDRWSIAECIEHLAITEKGILVMVRDQMMQAAPNPDQKPAQSPSDEQLLKGLSSRERKVQTRESMVPTGQFGDAKGTIKAFDAAREQTETYIKTTSDALRAHYQQGPVGMLDGYQWLVFMAGHTQRHIGQIEEIKADTGFPTGGKAKKPKKEKQDKKPAQP